MTSISGMANGQRYDMKVSAQHLDGMSTSGFGSTQCLRTTGVAGMELNNNSYSESLSMEGIQLYPNPNNGSEVLLYISNMEGSLQIEVFDAMGRLL
jgi:hypothetical protein